jgi:hypothetical protein
MSELELKKTNLVKPEKEELSEKEMDELLNNIYIKSTKNSSITKVGTSYYLHLPKETMDMFPWLKENLDDEYKTFGNIKEKTLKFIRQKRK